MIVKNSIVFNGKTLYTIKAVAKMTGYSEFHIRKLAREGKITGQKIGPKQWFFERGLVLNQLKHAGDENGLSWSKFEETKQAKLLALTDDL